MTATRSVLGRISGWHVLIVLLAAVLAVLTSFRVTLADLSLHARSLEFGVAKQEIFIDTPTSQLLDANQDVFGPPERAFTYVMYLQTDAARATIARSVGLQPNELAASGPFTELVNRPNIVRKLPVPGPPAPQDRDYRILLDVTDSRPVLTIYAQAPTQHMAVALVDATSRLLRVSVAERLRAVSEPDTTRTVLRTLGPVTGGMVDHGLRWQLSVIVFLVTVAVGFGLLRWRRRRTRLGLPPREPARPPLDAPSESGDDWPHTTRVLPWGLAGFVAMIFLVPFDQVSLPISMPMDGKLDRPLLGILALVWFASLLGASGGAKPRLRLTRVHVAALVFFSICCLSAVFNAPALLSLDEFSLVVKKLALLASFVLFFVIVVSVVRPAEVPRFATYMLVLAVVAAVGSIWEYRLRYNPFYEWTNMLLPGSVAFPPDMYGRDIIGRLTVYGPTGHPLELATMLAMMVPFALLGFLLTTERRRRILYAIAMGLLLTGALATSRKTSVIAPAVGVLVVLAYRPAMARKLLVLGLVMGALVHVVAPGSIGSMIFQLSPTNIGAVRSTQDRTSDYDGIRPDVLNHLLVGRGYQSYDGYKYRILDNQYLGLAIGVGLLGVFAYLAIGAAMMSTGHRMIRGPDPLRARYALAGSAAVAVVGVASLLFDTLSFPHVPYLLFFISGLVIVMRQPAPAAEAPSRVTARAPARPRRAASRPVPAGVTAAMRADSPGR
jgi:Fe2+ transport system protein FeoA